MKFNQKGFTIIELIVVIAIIAVLAAIVLVNVTQYINKGRDAAIKGNLTTIATNAASYFDDPTTFGGSSANVGTYTGFSALAAYTGPVAAINSAKTQTVQSNFSASAYCVAATIYGSATKFCVDSTGFKGDLGSSKCTGSSYACN